LEARHRGTKTHKRKPWNQHFSSGRGKFYALVHNAAYDYYTRVVPTYGLKMPRKCRISAKYNLSGRSEHRADILTLLPTSDIRVNRKKGGAYQGSDGIYAATVHELTHAGHRELDPGMFTVFSYSSCDRKILQESWAEGVETIVTNDRHFKLNSNYKSTESRDKALGLARWGAWRQRREVIQLDEYTPIVEDLIDNLNQHKLNLNFPKDNVEGYKLSTIEKSLSKCRTPSQWKIKLNHYGPSSVTSEELDELFNYFQQVRNNLDTPCN